MDTIHPNFFICICSAPFYNHPITQIFTNLFLERKALPSAPRKTMISSLVKIQPEEGLATTSELNLAPSLVTGCSEAKGMGYWAATQVKGFSHEILIVSVADAVWLAEGSTLIADSLNRTWRGDASPTGSETVARYQMDIMVTREIQSVLLTGVCPIKPINGKMVQMTLWELRSILIKLFKSLTDQFIVPEKRGNACRGEGPAGTHHLYP